jgi:hypothetical protein
MGNCKLQIANCKLQIGGQSCGVRAALKAIVRLFILQFAICNLQFAMAAPAGDDEPPIVGQPDHFNGAVGRFQVATAADKVKLQAEDPLTYSVRVTAEGKVKQPPQRPPLADFPGFADGFYIEDVGPADGRQPDRQTWEFTYRLKPKNTTVKAVPGFPFVFFRPGFLPPRLGYMTAYAKEIPITVTPREAVAPATKPVAGSAAAFALADGDVLRHDGTGRLPGPFVLVMMLLVPPLGCVAWYFVWRRLNPGAARLARRRRSRAAQEALKALGTIDKDHDPEEQARQAAAAVADYLRQRLELPVIEPTPAEAEAHLRGQGISEKLAGQTVDLLRTCAAVRFDPQPPPPADLAEAANGVILALEAETWSE